LAIIVAFSASTLVFGLGTAALLRATHEEFANAPLKSLQAPPANLVTETPTLALLQVEPLQVEPWQVEPLQVEPSVDQSADHAAQGASPPEVLATPATLPAQEAQPTREAKALAVETQQTEPQQTEPQTRPEDPAAQDAAAATGTDGESAVPLIVLSDPPSPPLTDAVAEATPQPQVPTAVNSEPVKPAPDLKPQAASQKATARHRPRVRHRAHRPHRRIVRQRPAPPPPPPQPSFFPLFDPPFATAASTVVPTTPPPPRR
jgi:hypothetical protein